MIGALQGSGKRYFPRLLNPSKDGKIRDFGAKTGIKVDSL